MNGQLYEILKRDAIHAGVSYPSGSFRRLIFDQITPNYSFKYIKLLRYKEFYKNKGTKISRLIAKLYEIKLHKLGSKIGFYIPKDVFGPGLYIPHIGSVIVNPKATIGENCQINNNVVLGQIGGYAPVVGDNVYIGPGAVVSGDIYIANNVWIGANAVVTKSICEEGVLVGGIPAVVIAKKSHNWVEVFNEIKKSKK